MYALRLNPPPFGILRALKSIAKIPTPRSFVLLRHHRFAKKAERRNVFHLRSSSVLNTHAIKLRVGARASETACDVPGLLRFDDLVVCESVS